MNNWIYKVFLLTFLLSILFTGITSFIAHNTNQLVMLIVIVVVLIISIIFDVISTSVLTSKESTFHAMNSKRIKGAKEGLLLIKNNVKVVSVCNDVIGDILGIASGGLGAVLAISISLTTGVNVALISIIIAAFISALTVGGKAVFKEVAVKNSDKIVFRVGKIISFMKWK